MVLCAVGSRPCTNHIPRGRPCQAVLRAGMKKGLRPRVSVVGELVGCCLESVECLVAAPRASRSCGLTVRDARISSSRALKRPEMIPM